MESDGSLHSGKFEPHLRLCARLVVHASSNPASRAQGSSGSKHRASATPRQVPKVISSESTISSSLTIGRVAQPSCFQEIYTKCAADLFSKSFLQALFRRSESSYEVLHKGDASKERRAVYACSPAYCTHRLSENAAKRLQPALPRKNCKACRLQ